MCNFIIKYLLLLLIFFQPKNSLAEENIRIVGSKIVNYYLSFIIEDYTKLKHELSPIIEASGSGTGINLLCSNQADIAASSRKITEIEREKCQENGIKDLGVFVIGRDAVIFATAKTSKIKNISLKNLNKILAHKTVFNENFIDNPYFSWHQIDTKYPDQEIEIYGPYISSGSRHLMVEKISEKHCMKDKFYIKKFGNIAERKKYCDAIRNDGKYIEIGDNQNLLVNKLLNNPNSLAILNYGHALAHQDKIDFLRIDDIYPNENNIRQGIYPFSRNLYIYYDKNKFSENFDKKLFIDYLEKSEILAKNGYLEKKGLIYYRLKSYKN